MSVRWITKAGEETERENLNHEDAKNTKMGGEKEFSPLSFVLFVSSWFNWFRPAR